MKTTPLHVRKLILLVACSIFTYYAQAQCSNSEYQDLIDWINDNNHALEAQITIINAAGEDGTHYYSAWGKSNVSFTGDRTVNSKFPCQFTTPDYFKLLYSDRTKGFIENVEQPFSGTQPDEQSIAIDVVNNTIISESRTWQYTVTYNNITRNGDILYASAAGSMIVINLHKIIQSIIR